MRKAIDFANWTGIPTPFDIACLQAAGYDTVIVGCSYDRYVNGVPQHHGRQQLEAFLAAGFRLEAYCWLRHPVQVLLLQRTIDAIAGLPVERLWLDVEDADDAAGKSPASLAADVEFALQYLHDRTNVPTGIYTGSWFWGPYMQTDNTFGEPLWLANYVSQTSLEFIAGRIPGGWNFSDLIIWQHSNHLPICSYNADDNLIIQETEERVKYTDDILDKAFISLLETLGKSLDIANTAAGAIINHIATHPNGGATTTMMSEISDLIAKQDALTADITKFKAAIAAAAGANGNLS